MKAHSQKAFLLKIVKLNDSKSILTFLGEKTGKVSALSFIKTGKNRGQDLDYFNELEIEYQEKESYSLIQLKNVALMRSFNLLRQDYDRLDLAFSWIKLLNLTLIEKQEHQKIYNFFLKSLEDLNQKELSPYLTDLRLRNFILKDLGFEIMWHKCRSCGKNLLTDQNSLSFEISEGAFYCLECHEGVELTQYKDYQALMSQKLENESYRYFLQLLKKYSAYHLHIDLTLF